MSAPSTTCGINGNQVTLQWTPPTNTGGQGVMITHYELTGLPQSASCSTGPCDNITSTTTTITGLQCNDDIIVNVSAVNCRAQGSSMQVMINLSPPSECTNCKWLFLYYCHLFKVHLPLTGMTNCIDSDNDILTLDWTVSLCCVQNISCNIFHYRLPWFKVIVALVYSLTVSNADSSLIMMNTITTSNARVPIDDSDDYTVTISSSNGCSGEDVEIGECTV